MTLKNPMLACVEVGGGGAQTVLFDRRGRYEILDGAHQPEGTDLALAVPGIIEGDRVVAASNLDWHDVDPVTALALAGPARVVLNDAQAAALGESVLRRGADVVYAGLGTGVGGAIVSGGRVIADNLFGHAQGFGAAACRCGETGCLETVAAGWALPDPATPDDVDGAGRAVAAAIAAEPLAQDGIVVVGGGMARAHPRVVDVIRAGLPDRRVEGSRAPEGAKSAAAWGLARATGYVRTGERR